MVNKSYLKGYRFEKRVQKFLEGEGWWVKRSGKSSFPDLICVSGGKVWVVECKWTKPDRKAFQELASLKFRLGCDCSFATNVKGKIVFIIVQLLL